LVDLGFKRFQETLRRTARAFLTEACTLERLRVAEASEAGFERETYREMARLGWFAPALPVADGGKEDDLVNQVILYEEFGRAALPGPHFVSTVLGQHMLARFGSEAQQGLVPSIVQGERIVTLAMYEESAGYDASSVRLCAEPLRSEFRLSGRKLFVPYAQVADSLLVLARTGDVEAQLSWFVVPAESAGLRVRPLEAMGSDKLFEVELDGVEVREDALLGPLHGGWEEWQSLLPLATVLQAAELVGLADAALEIGIEYAKMRVAFGRPIGAFQAIQHKCADMLSDTDAARYLTYEAVCLLKAGQSDAPPVAMAKPFAATAARRVTKEAHQILAGVGFTLDHRLNYYYRRAKSIELALGDVDAHLERVAQRLAL
jgi:alkylation response protein AidB-like acyl-CoA dehydrogenase